MDAIAMMIKSAMASFTEAKKDHTGFFLSVKTTDPKSNLTTPYNTYGISIKRLLDPRHQKNIAQNIRKVRNNPNNKLARPKAAEMSFRGMLG